MKMLIRKFEKKPVLWVWLHFFSPPIDTNSKTSHYLLSFLVRLNTLKVLQNLLKLFKAWVRNAK